MLEPTCIKVEEHKDINVPNITQNVFLTKIESPEEFKIEALAQIDTEPEDLFINFTPETYSTETPSSNYQNNLPKWNDEDKKGKIINSSKRDNTNIKEKVLQLHGRGRLGNEVPGYKCCGLIFKSYPKYRTHFVRSKKHLGEKLQEPFSKYNDYYSTRYPEVKCDICGIQMRSRTLRRHMLNKHWGERPPYKTPTVKTENVALDVQ